ncbi:tetraspanin-33-like isoform X1 [Haemaphysalis longicornis]
MWLAGLGMLVAALMVYLQKVEEEKEGEEVEFALGNIDVHTLIFTRLDVVLALAGGALFVVSFCGCVGTLRENLFLLQLYSCTLTLIITANVLFCAAVIILPGGVKQVVEQTLSEKLVIHYRDTVDSAQLVDTLQRGLKCCGMTTSNFRDWNRNDYFHCSAINLSHERCSVPASCCKTNESSADVQNFYCGRNVLNMSDHEAWYLVYVESCPMAANRFIKEHSLRIGGLSLLIVIVLGFLDMMVMIVIDEIKIILKIYKNVEAAHRF